MNQSMNQRDMFFKWLYLRRAVLLLVLAQSLKAQPHLRVGGAPVSAAGDRRDQGHAEGPAEAGVRRHLRPAVRLRFMPGVIPVLLYPGVSGGESRAGGDDRRGFWSQGFQCQPACGSGPW